jgi:hypothetical protein
MLEYSGSCGASAASADGLSRKPSPQARAAPHKARLSREPGARSGRRSTGTTGLPEALCVGGVKAFCLVQLAEKVATHCCRRQRGWSPISGELYVRSEALGPEIVTMMHQSGTILVVSPRAASRPQESTVARTIRIPAALRKRIAADAERCGRSFEGQVIALLRRHYGEDVDIAPGPAGILALALASLADVPVSERDLLTRKLREPEV